MTKLLELLNLILSFGPKLDDAMKEVEIIVLAFQRLAALFSPPKFAAAAIRGKPLNARESAAVAKIMAAMGRKAKFGGPFADIFAWLKAHPAIVEMLLKYLPMIIFAK